MGWGGIGTQRLVALRLNFSVGPAGDFDVEADDLGFGLVGVERDVVPEGDGLAVLLKPDTPVL
jgi:hypothetical protein